MKILNNYEEVKQYINKKSVLIFSSSICPDCTFLEHFIHEIEEKYPQYSFVELNIGKFKELVEDLEIRGVPSLVAYNNNRIVGRLVNRFRKGKKEISEFMEQVINNE